MLKSNKKGSTEKNRNGIKIFDDALYDLILSEKYHPKNSQYGKLISIETLPNGKQVNFYENDKREYVFPSGNRREIYSDGYQIIFFNNKDIKQVLIYQNWLCFLLNSLLSIIDKWTDFPKWQISLFLRTE